MKTHVKAALLMAGLCSTGLAFGQRNSSDDRYDSRYDDRSSRQNTRRDDRNLNDRFDEYRDRQQQEQQYRRYDNRYDDRRGNDNSYDNSDLSKAYDEGFEDGMRSKEVQERKERHENYKHFTFGVYAGANSTRFEGETVDGKNLNGRLGYQLGFFVRGGGRLYGQIGAEYLTSSNDFYKPGDGQASSPKDIIANIDQKYLHVPAYIGVKLAQSERGVSGVRLAVGAEYAAPLGVGSNDLNLQQSDFRAATVNGLANLGFDAGPISLEFVYHHGFADVLEGANSSKRRILGVNVALKF